MEMKTVSCLILLFVTLVHVDARLGFEPTLMNQGDCQSSAYIRQTELLLRDLFDQENLCKSTGQCTDESMSPRKDAITPLLTQSAKCYVSSLKVDECGECSEAVKQIFAGLQTPRMIVWSYN
ncbi:hypothetical protein BHM03_00031397 [Ensete ventricosum]|nr:hypothetical protein BHM03_00031397 [Ensete ventricosum]